MTTTPETPEQTITEAMNYVDELLAASQTAPYCGNDVYAEQIVEALRARGFALVGAPTEEQVESAARAMALVDEQDGCFERIDQWNALEQWERDAHPDEEPCMDREDAEMWRKWARAALAAAGVAPQEPSEERCPECLCLNSSHGSVHVRHPQGGGGWNRPCSRAQAKPAPSPDREKLALHYCPAHGDLILDADGKEVTPRSPRCREAHTVAEIAAALAAAPVLDEAKLAEEICRKIHSTKWTHRATSAPCEDCWRAAGAVAEALRGGGR